MRLFCWYRISLNHLTRYCICILVIVSLLIFAEQVSLLSTFVTISKFRGLRGTLSVRSALENITIENQPDFILLENNHNASEFQNVMEVEVENSTDDDITPTATSDVTTGQTTESALLDGSKNNTTHKKPMILFWNPNQYPTWKIPKEEICGGGCRMTTKRKRFNHSNVIIFTMKDFNLTDVPDKTLRKPDQLYIWFTEESAWASKNMYEKDFRDIEQNYFNWTMSFKQNSDVNAMMIPYSAREFVEQLIKEKEKNHQQDFTHTDKTSTKSDKEVVQLKQKASKLFRRKNKTAVWVASNCGYTAGAVLRRDLVTRLQFNGLEVDIFGDCGEKNVSDSLGDFAAMLSEYKFYLSFENALHCREYITEKFWYNSRYAGVIPIVWGPLKTDVEAVAPKNSFIHYDDFKTENHLVEYLLKLSKNESLYMEYFSWWWKTPGYYPVYGVTEENKHIYERSAIYDFEISGLCHLCYLLSTNVHKQHRKSITSLHKLWYTNETRTCLKNAHGVKIKSFESDGAGNAYKLPIASTVHLCCLCYHFVYGCL